MQKVGVVYTKFLLSATPSCVLLDVFQSFGFPVSLCWHVSPMATFKVSLPCSMSSLGCSDPGVHPLGMEHPLSYMSSLPSSWSYVSSSISTYCLHCGVLWEPAILGQHFSFRASCKPAQSSSWPPPILTMLELLDAKPHQVCPVWDWGELMVHLGDELIGCSCMY